MHIDTIIKTEVIRFFDDFNSKLNSQYFYNEEFKKYDALESFLLKVCNNGDIIQIKNEIWEQIPAALIKEGKKDKLTKKRFYCSNGTITRDELFVLSIVLKLDKANAVALINGLFKEMYVNYANPYDLLYDYCIDKKVDISLYMDYKKQVDDIFIHQPIEMYVKQLENVKNVTKTHEIVKKYKKFLETNQGGFIEFLKQNQNDFHYYSHYIYKLYYYILSSSNDYYKMNYLNSTTNTYTMLVDESKSIRLTQIDRDLRYHLDNMKSYYDPNHVYINPSNWNVFFEYCNDTFSYSSAMESDKTKGRSLIGILEANKDINRTLLIMTSILCGIISEDELNQIINQVALIRPEVDMLEDKRIVDYWIKKTLEFASVASKKYEDSKVVFEQVKTFMKISRVLMIIYLEQASDKKAYVKPAAQMSLYANDLMKYFTNHTKLTYMKGNTR